MLFIEFGSVSGQLEASKRAAQTLESRSRDLEEELSRSQKHNDQLSIREKDLSDRLRQKVGPISQPFDLIDTIQPKERELDISRSDAASAQQKAGELATRLRDLQEQIQADDRAEKLEVSLKGLQERSDSLESQLARVRQVIWIRVSTFGI